MVVFDLKNEPLKFKTARFAAFTGVIASGKNRILFVGEVYFSLL
jgi:hypothetical protein